MGRTSGVVVQCDNETKLALRINWPYVHIWAKYLGNLGQKGPSDRHQVPTLRRSDYSTVLRSYERNWFPPPYSLFCTILGARPSPTLAKVGRVLQKECVQEDGGSAHSCSGEQLPTPEKLWTSCCRRIVPV